MGGEGRKEVREGEEVEGKAEGEAKEIRGRRRRIEKED
jgi:hypothetical protein